MKTVTIGGQKIRVILGFECVGGLLDQRSGMLVEGGLLVIPGRPGTADARVLYNLREDVQAITVEKLGSNIETVGRAGRFLGGWILLGGLAAAAVIRRRKLESLVALHLKQNNEIIRIKTKSTSELKAILDWLKQEGIPIHTTPSAS